MPLRRRGSQARRHPRRRVALNLPAPGHITFEELVAEALDDLPPQVQQLLENVAIVIEDEPSREQLRGEGMEGEDTLYGLYEGVPATEYGADWSAMPNKITLFRLPLEEDFADPDDLADEVRLTVIHELAHHAGIGDERLEELDLD